MRSARSAVLLFVAGTAGIAVPHNDPPFMLSSKNGQPLPSPDKPSAVIDANEGILIKNSCQFPIYLREVQNPESAAKLKENVIDRAVIEPDEYWTSPLVPTTEGGISVKLSKEEFKGAPEMPITQVEYMFEPNPWRQGSWHLWYDMSNVDCYTPWTNDAGDEDGNSAQCPFFWDGFHMHSWAGCRDTLCEPGEPRCGDVYLLPDDNHATLNCGVEPSRLWFEVCPGKLFNRHLIVTSYRLSEIS